MKKSLFSRHKKVCYICKKTKLATSFYAHRSRADGLQSRCKACNSVKRFSFICPNCKHKFATNRINASPCPKCWRVSKPVTQNY